MLKLLDMYINNCFITSSLHQLQKLVLSEFVSAALKWPKKKKKKVWANLWTRNVKFKTSVIKLFSFWTLLSKEDNNDCFLWTHTLIVTDNLCFPSVLLATDPKWRPALLHRPTSSSGQDSDEQGEGAPHICCPFIHTTDGVPVLQKASTRTVQAGPTVQRWVQAKRWTQVWISNVLKTVWI